MLLDKVNFMTYQNASIPAPGSGNREESLRVLIVDDDPAILFAYCRLIEHEGMTIDSCSNLHDALRMIRSYTYFAVITDLRLAGTDNTDGLDVIRTLQRERPDTQIILTTGCATSEIEQTARDLGTLHFFEKPVHPSVILDSLKALGALITHPLTVVSA